MSSAPLPFRRIAAVALLPALLSWLPSSVAAAAAVPPAAPAHALSHDLRLAVTFTPRLAEPYERAPLVGELDLHVLDGGRISGYYRPEANRSAIPLTGATTTTGTFLDIGDGFQNFHVDGMLVDAPVRGSSLAGTARIGDEIYDVQATPCQSDRGEVSILCQ